MSTGVSFTLEQDGQKSGGAMPPSLKSKGPPRFPPHMKMAATAIMQEKHSSPF